MPKSPSIPECPQLRDAPKVPFQDIFDAWKAGATVKPRVAGDTRGIIDLFARFLGHDDAALVTTEDFRRWRQTSLSVGLNNNTWNNRLSMVRQVFDFAVIDRMLPSNPACQSLRLKPKKNESPLPYSDEQAAQILSASREQDRPSRRWAHWIMAFTGMRVAEVLQLSVSDLREDGGILVHLRQRGRARQKRKILRAPEYPYPFCAGS